MINEFIKRLFENTKQLENKFRLKHPDDYKELVKWVIESITLDEGYNLCPDPEIIHEINDGNYQGTLVYLIPEKGYQPSTYYYVMIDYGSCSVCDTLGHIEASNNENPDQQVKDYMTLALHIVQRIKKMGDE